MKGIRDHLEQSDKGREEAKCSHSENAQEIHRRSYTSTKLEESGVCESAIGQKLQDTCKTLTVMTTS